MLSGGADSMAMLALVRDVERRLELGLRLGALHIDYGLRGTESSRDREIVVRACAAADVELDVVELGARLRGPDFQSRARDLRYARARDVVAREGHDVVAAAHNRDDQAETVLYRLAKYASPQALVGMRPREGGALGRAALARPLLCLGADEVRAYCRAAGIEFGDDATNAQLVYARNVVRHEILPRLAELNPRVVETLAAGADIAADEREVVDAAAKAAWRRVSREPGEDLASLDIAALGREPQALRALCLRALVRCARGDGALVQRDEVERLAALAVRADDAGSVPLRGGWEVVRGGGRLCLRRRTPPHACAPVALTAGGRRVSFCGRGYAAAVADGVARRPARGVVPLEARVGLAGPAADIVLRHPARGERFTPFGMAHETTVARFLAAARAPRAARERAVVLAVDGRVAWVAYGTSSGERRGRVAQPFRVTESTRCTLHVVEEEV
jgi:tRNA(Ile)-lysidine synthase